MQIFPQIDVGTAPPPAVAVRFRVLGPVQVEAGGRLLDIGPRQRRMVLAALAVDAGSPVPIETLVHRVWGSAAPDAPRSALYAHVARLRSVLSRAGAADDAPVNLNRNDAGYVLDIDPQSVDLHRFLALVEAGRSPAEPSRMGLLREALDLWRGPPLPAAEGDWAARLRSRVESQFIGAATTWAEEELRQAHPEPVADRLARVVAAYPIAEPVVALLMRALCALGRVAEALQRYADTRARLADELGTEPSQELSRLHVAILRGQYHQPPQAAGGTGAPGAEPRPKVPRQLPADLSHLTGRAEELQRVTQWFAAASRSAPPAPQPRPAVLTVHGPAGVGKSALAVHAAHLLAPLFPDGQLYLDMRGSRGDAHPLEPVRALARLLRALGATAAEIPEDVDEAGVLFRSLVAGRRLLILLDNASTAGQVRPLLPGDPACATIVTGRRALLGLGDVGQVRVAPLPAEQSMRLLRQWIGAARFAAEPDAAAVIATVCEGLPLALCAAGARLAARPAWTLEELARRLADPARRLDNVEFGAVGIRGSLGSSLRHLAVSADAADRAAAEAFALLGATFGAGFDHRQAADLLARSPAEAERMLDRLVDAELLESVSPQGYRMRGLPRLYARERLAANFNPAAARQDPPKTSPGQGRRSDRPLAYHAKTPPRRKSLTSVDVTAAER